MNHYQIEPEISIPANFFLFHLKDVGIVRQKQKMGRVIMKERFAKLARTFGASGILRMAGGYTLGNRVYIPINEYQTAFIFTKDRSLCVAVYHWNHNILDMWQGTEVDLDAELKSMGC
jgi:hypothetical protein